MLHISTRMLNHKCFSSMNRSIFWQTLLPLSQRFVCHVYRFLLLAKAPPLFRVLMSRVSCLFSALLSPHSERSYSGRRSCECGRMTPRGAREFAASEMLKSLDVSLRNKPTPLSFSRSHVGIKSLPGLGL